MVCRNISMIFCNNRLKIRMLITILRGILREILWRSKEKLGSWNKLECNSKCRLRSGEKSWKGKVYFVISSDSILANCKDSCHRNNRRENRF